MNGTNPANEPFLSICIATLERAEMLRQTLACIVPQLTDEVELLIVDGGSKDRTEEVANSFANGRIHYHRLPVKGGVDNDFREGLERAAGRYVWFFCDDDFFEPGAVGKVIDRLKREAPDLLVVNGRGWDDETGEILKENFLGFEEDRRYAKDDQARLFEEVAAYITYIGAVVVRREMWLSRPHSAYAGSELAHIGVVFHAPLANGAVAIGEPLVRLRLLSSQWTSRSFKIWMVNWPRLVWSLPFPKRVLKRVVSPRPWRNLAKLVVLRASGDFHSLGFRDCIQPAEPNPIYRTAAACIARLPVEPLRVLVLAAYRLLVPSRKLRVQQLTRRRHPRA